MQLFGKKAKAAALFVAILVALYGTTEASPPKRKRVRFKGGGHVDDPGDQSAAFARSLGSVMWEPQKSANSFKKVSWP